MKLSVVQLVAAVVVVMGICLLRESVAHSIHRPLSGPLHSADTDTMVQLVAQHAQSSDNDTDTKLMPDIDTKKNHRDICCLHANILDFYLSNILTTKEKQDKHHPKLPALKEDLARVSRDLKEHGCVSYPFCRFALPTLLCFIPLSLHPFFTFSTFSLCLSLSFSLFIHSLPLPFQPFHSVCLSLSFSLSIRDLKCDVEMVFISVTDFSLSFF
uniref:Interleukin 22 n=1 Tax=Hucho hucho TaxID=62062 RepID=A0A4W5KPH2_9TELE